jgi:MFS family permease
MTGGLGLAGILGLQPGLTSLLAVFFLSGVGSAWLFVPLRAVLQRETEPELMGRVAALSEAANMGALLLAPFLGVALASISSVSWAFVGGGILKLCVAVLALSLAFGPGHGD